MNRRVESAIDFGLGAGAGYWIASRSIWQAVFIAVLSVALCLTLDAIKQKLMASWSAEPSEAK